jgi:DNA-3-methyladenine glycosylase II
VAPPAPAAPALAPPAAPTFWANACADLTRSDPVLGEVIRACGPQGLVPRGDPFLTLARSVVGQQISVAAAQAIWNRFEKACGQVHPDRVSRMRASTLTGCGLSVRKVYYLRDLARGFLSGELDPSAWPALDDEAVITELTRVRGIGRWTAEMFLIFNLQRPDVLPLDDIGLLRAVALHYPVADGPDDDAGTAARHRRNRVRAQALGENWRPWRSVATWYLWRSLDPVAVEY